MKTLIITLVAAFTLALAPQQGNAQDKGDELATIEIKTSAVCGMCKDRLEREMAYTKGVKSSSLDTKSKVLTVTYKPSKTNPEAIRKVISQAGYDADEVAAVPKAYEKLPACCHKDSKCTD